MRGRHWCLRTSWFGILFSDSIFCTPRSIHNSIMLTKNKSVHINSTKIVNKPSNELANGRNMKNSAMEKKIDAMPCFLFLFINFIFGLQQNSSYICGCDIFGNLLFTYIFRPFQRYNFFFQIENHKFFVFQQVDFSNERYFFSLVLQKEDLWPRIHCMVYSLLCIRFFFAAFVLRLFLQ